MFSLYKAPVKVLKKLESIRCNFFWGGASENRKIPWVAWHKLLNSKEKGGLGIGSLQALNQALLVKWWWRYKKDSGSLWKKVIDAIHGPDGNLNREVSNSNYRSVWGIIANLNKTIDLGNIDLRNLFFTSDDGWEWGLEDNGLFTVASCRRLMDDFLLSDLMLPTYWNKLVPNKVNILLWRARLGKIQTKSNLRSRGIQVGNVECPFCHRAEETEAHIFGHCSFAKEVLAIIKVWCDDFPGINNSLDDMVMQLINIEKSNKCKGRRLGCIYAAFIWIMWWSRNQIVYKGSTNSCSIVVGWVKFYSYLWVSARDKLKVNVSWDSWNCKPILM